MEKVPFRLLDHYMIKAMDKAGISFPISKEELLDKADGYMVKIGYDAEMSLKTICSRMNCAFYENKDQFFCILRNTSLLTEQ